MITLQFIPHVEIERLSSADRISKLLHSVKESKIVLLEGRLKPHEEAELIRKTMEEIDDSFKGIELSVIYPERKDDPIIKRLRNTLVNLLLGNRTGFTIIGPAKIVKKIKQDPDKIQLITEDSVQRGSKKK
ncbi:DUF2073 domain-containing protein [Candidatus Woesearchaeota archaeon]|nr:MAG: DUF2073 domain-containing protein [Candidatus Woesearchaeota archaeon]